MDKAPGECASRKPLPILAKQLERLIDHRD
jgi:hypothetical protein